MAEPSMPAKSNTAERVPAIDQLARELTSGFSRHPSNLHRSSWSPRTTNSVTVVHRHNLRGGSVAAIMGHLGDCIPLQFVAPPAAGHRWSATGAVKYVLIRDSRERGHEVRSVAVGAEGN